MRFAKGWEFCVTKFQLTVSQILMSITYRYCERYGVSYMHIIYFSEFQGCGKCLIMRGYEIQNSCGALKSLLFWAGSLIWIGGYQGSSVWGRMSWKIFCPFWMYWYPIWETFLYCEQLRAGYFIQSLINVYFKG